MHPANAPTAPQAPAATAAPAAAQATELQLTAPATLLCAAQDAVGTLQECAIWAKAGGWTKAAATIQRQADELQAALLASLPPTPPTACAPQPMALHTRGLQ